MTTLAQKVDEVVSYLEDVQTHVGQVQKALLDLLISEESDQYDISIQQAIFKLEHVQKSIGETQLSLLDRTEQPKAQSVVNIPEPESVNDYLDPRIWLKDRNFQFTIRPVSRIDRHADRTAEYLGDNYDVLGELYALLKRSSSGPLKPIHLSVRDYTDEKLEKILGFGTMLLEGAFLSQFDYVKNQRSIHIQLQQQGAIQNFFTGGWMERYVLYLIAKHFKKANQIFDEKKVLVSVQVQFSVNEKTDLDLLIGLPRNKVLWIECKTGRWADYVTRFKTLNRNFMRLPETQAALILLDAQVNSESASELAGMSVLRLKELASWLTENVRLV